MEETERGLRVRDIFSQDFSKPQVFLPPSLISDHVGSKPAQMGLNVLKAVERFTSFMDYFRLRVVNQMPREQQDRLKANIADCREVIKQIRPAVDKRSQKEAKRNREEQESRMSLGTRPRTTFTLLQQLLASEALNRQLDRAMANMAEYKREVGWNKVCFACFQPPPSLYTIHSSSADSRHADGGASCHHGGASAVCPLQFAAGGVE